MSDPSPSNNRQLGGILAAGGGILILFAVLRLNSFASQLVRGLGGNDGLATTLLVLGVPAALIGVGMLLKAMDPDTVSNTTAGAGKEVAEASPGLEAGNDADPPPPNGG